MYEIYEKARNALQKLGYDANVDDEGDGLSLDVRRRTALQRHMTVAFLIIGFAAAAGLAVTNHPLGALGACMATALAALAAHTPAFNATFTLRANRWETMVHVAGETELDRVMCAVQQATGMPACVIQPAAYEDEEADG